MDRWKSRGGKSQRREKGRRKKIYMFETSATALCGTVCMDRCGFNMDSLCFCSSSCRYCGFLRVVHVSHCVRQSTLQSRRGISKTHNRGSILELLNEAGGKYNFVYMPAGRSTHAGLAIVNFVDAEACQRCFLVLKSMQDLCCGSLGSW